MSATSNDRPAVDAAKSADLVVKAKAFDWGFSRYVWLYDIMHALVWGPRLKKCLPHIDGPRVLEVSFGTGYLMARYAHRVQTTGIDYNPRYVEVARERMKKRGLEPTLLQGDVHSLPFPDASFDTVVNTDAFTLYDDPDKAMSELYRVLAPGGRLVLMEYDYPADGNWLGTLHTNWMRWMNAPYIEFGPLFRAVGFEYEDHDVGYSGMAHMFIATKPAS